MYHQACGCWNYFIFNCFHILDLEPLKRMFTWYQCVCGSKMLDFQIFSWITNKLKFMALLFWKSFLIKDFHVQLHYYADISRIVYFMRKCEQFPCHHPHTFNLYLTLDRQVLQLVLYNLLSHKNILRNKKCQIVYFIFTSHLSAYITIT